MTLTAPTALEGTRATLHAMLARTGVHSVAVPLGLLLIALGIRVVAATLLPFPVTEDGMYYEHVAQRFVEGHGLTSLALWSYSTPPLVLPRPAFEIWMPGASLWSVPFMALLGPTHTAAQAGSILLGSLVAPLAWWLGRDAAVSLGRPQDQVHSIAVGSGLLAAVLGPFVVAAADPDSMTVFLVTSALAAIAMQRTISAPTTAWCLLLGITLGLAYLSRQEAVWLGATYLVMLGVAQRSWRGRRRYEVARRLVPVIAGGLLIVAPWLVRQSLAFGTPLPGQALENALHTRGDDIFAYTDRPSLERFLAQGLDTLVAQRATAVGYQLQGLLVLAFPVGILGGLGAFALSRTAALRASGALFALVVSGGLTFLATAFLFPVATLWGTYRHSAGPLLLGCVVMSMVVGDMLLRRLTSALHGRHPTRWLAATILVGAAVPASWAWVSLFAHDSAALQRDMSAIAAQLRDEGLDHGTQIAGVTSRGESADVMSSLPIFTAATTGLRVLALPDEPPEAVSALARRFGVTTLVVIGARGRYPDALLGIPRHPCLAGDPEPISGTTQPAWLFHLDPGCVP